MQFVSGMPASHAAHLCSPFWRWIIEFHVVDGDHFFLLSKREETFRVIKAFLGKEVSGRSESQLKNPSPPAGSTSGPPVE